MKWNLYDWALWLLIVVVTVTFFFALPTHCAPVTFPQEPVQYSKIIEVNGVPMIRLPDGRVIPFGQSLDCTSGCAAIENNSPGRSRLWLLTIPAGIAVVIALWPDSSVVTVPRIPILPPPVIRPPVAVPESATLSLLGFGLLGIGILLRGRL